jgi:CheY-like chemotaxis protein
MRPDVWFQVQLASSGEAALFLMRQAVISQLPVEVALCDHEIPGTDGAMFGKQVREEAVFQDSRIVMLTSLDLYGDLDRFAELGFAGYLTKSVRAGTLRMSRSGARLRGARLAPARPAYSHPEPTSWNSCQGDANFERELITTFLESTAALIPGDANAPSWLV